MPYNVIHRRLGSEVGPTHVTVGMWGIYAAARMDDTQRQ